MDDGRKTPASNRQGEAVVLLLSAFKSMRVDAIVVAAGKSTRFAAKTKKPFFPLSGKPVLVYSLEVLQRSPLIHNIVLVVPAELRETIRNRIVSKYQLQRVRDIVAGGKRRQDSVWFGLQALAQYKTGETRIPDYVLIHDGVRPFITEKMINDVVRAAQQTGVATIATKVTDTVKLVDAQDTIIRTVPRNDLWCVQTPQVFQYSLLCSAYQHARRKKIYATDDAEIAERYGLAVKLILGSITNIKITTKEDLIIAEAILKSQ
jgi:2-C-methyl-D-erythritol 4-phosphate cytidylyltransferase